MNWRQSMFWMDTQVFSVGIIVKHSTGRENILAFENVKKIEGRIWNANLIFLKTNKHRNNSKHARFSKLSSANQYKINSDHQIQYISNMIKHLSSLNKTSNHEKQIQLVIGKLKALRCFLKMFLFSVFLNILVQFLKKMHVLKSEKLLI